MPALTFAPINRGKGNSFHLCRDHRNGTGSGRWRVAIAGHPVTAHNGDQLVVCDRCKKRLTSEWESVLNVVPEAVPA